MSKPLIVMALEQEAREHFHGLPVVFTGVGKVNAAYRLAKELHSSSYDHIINLGSAGSAHFKAGELVNCTRFVQRDMDATPLGFPLYHTPYEKAATSLLAYGNRIEPYPEGICGTGDSFHVGGAHDDFNVMDMEAYALARICQQEQKHFTCIKYITDGADGQAATDWETMLEQAAKALSTAYGRLSAA